MKLLLALLLLACCPVRAGVSVCAVSYPGSACVITYCLPDWHQVPFSFMCADGVSITALDPLDYLCPLNLDGVPWPAHAAVLNLITGKSFHVGTRVAADAVLRFVVAHRK